MIPFFGGPYVWAAAIAVGVGLFGTGYIKGMRAEQGKQAAAVLERVKLVRVVEQKQAQVTDTIATEHEQAKAKREVVTRTIEKEVTRYVQIPNRSVCGLDANWVRLHDFAAVDELPRFPDTPSKPDADAPSADTDEALRAVTANYRTANECIGQLTDLQRWVRAQQAVMANWEAE